MAERMGARNAGGLPSLSDFRSVMVVKPSSLGDIVHALPAVQALHEAWPQLDIRWLANQEWTPLLQGVPMLREVIAFPRKDLRGVGGIPKWLAWASKWRRLPRQEPEITLDFQGLLRSGLISRARGSRPVVGLSDSREGARFCHDHVIRVNSGDHAVDRYLAMPEAFGVSVRPEKLVFPLAAGERPTLWQDLERYIVVHPWSRGTGKSLDAASLRSLCEGLAPHPVVVVGVRSAQDEVPHMEHVHDWSNKTSLSELLWVLRRASFCISVDSGPMHIAAAVNDRTLGLHTWTDPRKVGPYNHRAWVWKAGRIAHRAEFTAQECLTEMMVTQQHAGEVASFVLAQSENR